MTRGDKRIGIMDECPEEFEETLKDFIDSLEKDVGEIRDYLEIRSIGDIGNIEDAYHCADKLAESLY